MPLSDNEQRLLEQMERALYAEDPKFASAMRGAARRGGSLFRVALGVTGIVAGLGVLLYSVGSGRVVFGVIGFILMLAGTAYALSTRRKSGPTGVVNGNGTVRKPTPPRQKDSFMQRMEQRWDRRRDER